MNKHISLIFAAITLVVISNCSSTSGSSSSSMPGMSAEEHAKMMKKGG